MQRSDKRWAARAFERPNQWDSKRTKKTTIINDIYLDVSSRAISCAIVWINCQMIAQTIAQAITQAIARVTTGQNFFLFILKTLFFPWSKIKLS